jgi:hypothetical protein
MTTTAAPEAAEAAEDRMIVAEAAVAGQRREVGDQRLDVVGEVRPVDVARDLRLLPGRQLAVGGREQLRRAALEPGDLVLEVELAAVGEVPQLLDLALELGDRLFEIQQAAHPSSLDARRSGRGRDLLGHVDETLRLLDRRDVDQPAIERHGTLAFLLSPAPWRRGCALAFSRSASDGPITSLASAICFG